MSRLAVLLPQADPRGLSCVYVWWVGCRNHDWQRPQKQLDMVSEDCLVLNVETPSLKSQG